MLHTNVISSLLEFILVSDTNQRLFLAEFAQLPTEFNSTEVIMPQTNEVFIKLVNKLNQVVSQVRLKSEAVFFLEYIHKFLLNE